MKLLKVPFQFHFGLLMVFFVISLFQIDFASAQTSCSYPNWIQGKSYVKGNIVKFTDGKLYIAENANPGYNPTISTWYWDPYSCVAMTPTTPTTLPPTTTTLLSPPSMTCSFSNWVQGKSYLKGDIVKFTDGKLYIAENANPGYNPTVSTWYWDPYVCSGTSTPTTPAPTLPPTTTTMPPTASSGFLITEAQFNQMFSDRISFYTYAGLVQATKAYPAIFATGSETVRRQELAAFLANIDHESGGLRYVREINTANYNSYCGASSQYPCASGQQYYGRGPIQLSWNYNYGAAGSALGLNLLADPDMVARDSVVAWKTAMWFWMTQTGAGRMTSHNAMVNQAGFGETIRTINGGLECSKPAGSTGYNQQQLRIQYYKEFTGLLGVAIGSNLGC